MKQEYSRRNFEVRLKIDEARENIIIGRPVVYDVKADLGEFEEIIERGALNNTDLTNVYLCVNHDPKSIIARSRRNNPKSKMRLKVDDEGLLITAELDVENDHEARRAYSLVKNEIIDGMSFAFRTNSRRDKWENIDTDKPLRRIREIEYIKEVSLVTDPAYSQTYVSARDISSLESERHALENAKKRIKNKEQLRIAKLKIDVLYGGKI